jgi:hypothetical protein
MDTDSMNTMASVLGGMLASIYAYGQGFVLYLGAINPQIMTIIGHSALGAIVGLLTKHAAVRSYRFIKTSIQNRRRK